MISPKQETLIDENGNFRYGKYSTSLREVSPLDLKAGVLGHLPRGLKDYRLKEWQAFMIGGKKILPRYRDYEFETVFCHKTYGL